jgi:hypothetical protein
MSGKIRKLDAESIEGISIENVLTGECSILTLYHICICFFPPQDRAKDRLSLLHTDAFRGTIREQFGYLYADIVW